MKCIVILSVLFFSLFLTSCKSATEIPVQINCDAYEGVVKDNCYQYSAVQFRELDLCEKIETANPDLLKRVCQIRVKTAQAIVNEDASYCEASNYTEMYTFGGDYVLLLPFMSHCFHTMALLLENESYCEYVFNTMQYEDSFDSFNYTPEGCLHQIYKNKAIKSKDATPCDELRSKYCLSSILDGYDKCENMTETNPVFQPRNKRSTKTSIIQCYQNVAVLTADETVCEKLEVIHSTDVLDWNAWDHIGACKKEVRTRLAEQKTIKDVKSDIEIKDESVCKEIEEKYKSDCYFELAKNKMELSLCDELTPAPGGITRGYDSNMYRTQQGCQNYVYLELAKKHDDPEYCDLINISLSHVWSARQPAIYPFKKIKTDCYYSFFQIEPENIFIEESMRFIKSGGYHSDS